MDQNKTQDPLIGSLRFNTGYHVNGYQPTGEPAYWCVEKDGQELSRHPSQWEATQAAKQFGRKDEPEDDNTVILDERVKKKG